MADAAQRLSPSQPWRSYGISVEEASQKVEVESKEELDIRDSNVDEKSDNDAKDVLNDNGDDCHKN